MSFFEKIFSSPKREPSEEEKEIVRQRLSQLSEAGAVAPAEKKDGPPPETKIYAGVRLTPEERQALGKELAEKIESLGNLRQWHQDYTAADREMDTNYEKEIEVIRKKLNASENI